MLSIFWGVYRHSHNLEAHKFALDYSFVSSSFYTQEHLKVRGEHFYCVENMAYSSSAFYTLHCTGAATWHKRLYCKTNTRLRLLIWALYSCTKVDGSFGEVTFQCSFLMTRAAADVPTRVRTCLARPPSPTIDRSCSTGAQLKSKAPGVNGETAKERWGAPCSCWLSSASSRP